MSNDRTSGAEPYVRDTRFFGHPRGLATLFFTETWERFSFYGLRPLLVLFMAAALAEGGFGFDRGQASAIVGIYGAFVYVASLPGGWVADRLLGLRRAILIGAILITVGHLSIGLSGLAGAGAGKIFFFLGLILIVFGTGLLKPNISAIVGDLYPEGGARRDAGFSIFYMGINLGAFAGQLVTGFLGEAVGWHYGFAAAGVGMILGLLVYHFGRRYVPQDSKAERQAKPKEASNTKMTADEWKRVGVICLLCFLNIVFWGIYEQEGNTLQLWADERTNWNFFGVNIPSTIYQSFNPGFIFIFAPILTIFWAWQFKRKKEPTSTMKMGIGCILCGLGFVIMIMAARALGDEGRGSVMWLTATTWMFTMGELYLSPIGLSFVSKVAPRRIASMMMGVWFLSSFFGNYASGLFGMLYSVMAKESFFAILAAAGVATGLIFVLLNKSIVRAVGKDA